MAKLPTSPSACPASCRFPSTRCRRSAGKALVGHGQECLREHAVHLPAHFAHGRHDLMGALAGGSTRLPSRLAYDASACATNAGLRSASVTGASRPNLLFGGLRVAQRLQRRANARTTSAVLRWLPSSSCVMTPCSRNAAATAGSSRTPGATTARRMASADRPSSWPAACNARSSLFDAGQAGRQECTLEALDAVLDEADQGWRPIGKGLDRLQQLSEPDPLVKSLTSWSSCPVSILMARLRPHPRARKY